jgi:hypothetical protein
MLQLADELKQLRDERDTTDAHAKELSQQISDIEYRLSNMMAESETQNFTHAGTMFCLMTKTRASAAAGVKDELYTALKSNGFGSLVYETVNANSLSSFVKEQIEENNDALPDWLTDLVNVFEQTTVSVRKATRK